MGPYQEDNLGVAGYPRDQQKAGPRAKTLEIESRRREKLQKKKLLKIKNKWIERESERDGDYMTVKQRPKPRTQVLMQNFNFEI